MATVSLKHVVKIYPNAEEDKKKKKNKKKNDEPEKKVNLKVTEEGVLAVDDFNLEIADKEFIVLVGPSGCGKSTTLRMVAGLEEITRGEISIDDRVVNDVQPKDRDIAMVFQSYALYPHMTVRQNLEFPLKLRKIDKAVRDAKVEEVAETLGITQYLDRKPKALSGGQRQRVAIGRAIVREPKVLLMDEPLSNLDAKLRNQMRAEIIKLRQKIDTTFIYVTHDQTEAMTLGDRIVIMKDGVVQQVGTPQEVFNSPSNLFVAGFIGMPQMNFYEGELLKDQSGKYQVKVQDSVFDLCADKQKRLSSHNVQPQKITVGVRPEHITVVEDSKSGAVLNGVVDVSEMMGSSVHLHVNTDGKDSIIIVPLLEIKESVFEKGMKIPYTFGDNVIHMFAEDGRNLEYIDESSERAW